MDIKHISTFLKVVETKSFTKAAQELQYSQSTISFHIRSLETELGIILFERNPRELKITTEGTRILNTCKLMKNCYHELLDLSADSNLSISPIHIASVSSFLIYRLSKVIKYYKIMYPNINIQLDNSPSFQYSKLLKENSADLCFFVEPDLVDNTIELVTLNREQMYLIIPNSYTFVNLEKLSSELTTCFSEVGCSYRKIFEKFLDFHNIKPSSVIESWSIEMIKQCVSSGIGYSILPEMCILEDINLNSYQAISLDANEYYVDLTMGYKKDRPLPSYLRHFMKLVFDDSKKFTSSLLINTDNNL